MAVSLQKLFTQQTGKGHHGHKGRKGKVGGSLPGKGSISSSSPAKPKEFSTEELRKSVPEDYEHGRDFAAAVGSRVGKKWKPSEETIQMFIKEEKWSEGTTKEQIVENIFMAWTGSSGGDIASEMMRGVAETHGIETAEFRSNPWFDSHPEFRSDIQSLGEIIYSDTQDYLKSIGVDSVRLYRSGLGNDSSKPFTSWSVTPGGFITTETSRQSHYADVPAKQIFSLANTGFGNIVEGEAVVLGEVEKVRRNHQQLFKQGSVGSGHHGHAGRPGKVGGSLPRGTTLSPEKPSSVQKYHNKIQDEGHWGNSHYQSKMITGEAANIMGIEGYERADPYQKVYQTDAERFLKAISDDEIGAEEMLHHGFQNTRNITFKPGDTFRIPLTASSGSLDDAAGYGLRLDRADQKGRCTVFVFPKGTAMAAYGKWNNEDAAEFGYKYTEAIVAGEFRIMSTNLIEMNFPQHDRRPGETWQPTSMVEVVELEPVSVFDMDTRMWRK